MCLIAQIITNDYFGKRHNVGSVNQKEENVRKHYKLNLYYAKGPALMHISCI